MDPNCQLVRFLEANFSADGLLNEDHCRVWIWLSWMPLLFFKNPLADWVGNKERNGGVVDYGLMAYQCSETREVMRSLEGNSWAADFSST